MLDAKTGKTRWKVDRDEVSSWATPLVTPYHGGVQIVVNATRRTRGYDLATGKVLWQCGGQTVNVIPSPVRFDDLAIAMSGFKGTAAYAIPLGSTGDITGTDRIAWHYKPTRPTSPRRCWSAIGCTSPSGSRRSSPAWTLGRGRC